MADIIRPSDVLVIGATGAIGGGLVALLKELGIAENVWAWSRDEPAKPNGAGSMPNTPQRSGNFLRGENKDSLKALDLLSISHHMATEQGHIMMSHVPADLNLGSLPESKRIPNTWE